MMAALLCSGDDGATDVLGLMVVVVSITSVDRCGALDTATGDDGEASGSG